MSALEERSCDSGSDSADPTGVEREHEVVSSHSEQDLKRAQRKRRLSKSNDGDAWSLDADSSLATPPLLSAPPAFLQLSSLQRAIIHRLRGMLDTHSDSVVITNPLSPRSPIVYVTEAWQEMCGYSMSQAVGQNPRLTQGENTDKETIRGMGIALSERRSCKVRLINYRGYNHEPFWNCLSVHPIFHQNNLVLHIAQLHDYSHRLNQLVSHRPIQFCVTDEHFQRSVPLTSIAGASHLRRPSRLALTSKHVVIERGVDGEDVVTFVEDSEAPPDTLKLPTLHVKRLGFFRIDLEPMYLIDRLVDEAEQMNLEAHASTTCGGDSEIYRLDVTSSNEGGGRVTAALHVLPEENGRYCITMTRLQGDTFGYHSLYRTLRQRLVDLQSK